MGQVQNPQGTPVPDVVLYLYIQPSVAPSRRARSSVTNRTTTDQELGTLSAITDIQGMYRFANLQPGIYRIEPNFTGLTFEPPNIAIDAGSYAPVLTANAVDLHDDGCVRSRTAEAVVAGDYFARRLLRYGERLADAYSDLARAQLHGAPRERLLSDIARAKQQMQVRYTLLLNTSELIPKIVLHCEGAPQCAPRDLGVIHGYYGHLLDNLRHLQFYIIRRTRRTLAAEHKRLDTEGSGTKTRLRHRTARTAWHGMPRQTYQCSEQ